MANNRRHVPAVSGRISTSLPVKLLVWQFGTRTEFIPKLHLVVESVREYSVGVRQCDGDIMHERDGEQTAH